MDVKKASADDLAKIAKAMKAGAKKQSAAATIKKAAKLNDSLKKTSATLKKLAKEDPKF